MKLLKVGREPKRLSYAYSPPVWTTILAASFAQYGPHADLGARYTTPGSATFEEDKARRDKTRQDKTRQDKTRQENKK